MQYEEHDRTTDVLLIILTLLLAVSAVAFYPILHVFPHWNIWIFIYGSIEIGFILILIYGIRSSVKSINLFFILANTLCIFLNSVLIFFYMVPRGIA
jgi:hypothetical protein